MLLPPIYDYKEEGCYHFSIGIRSDYYFIATLAKSPLIV